MHQMSELDPLDQPKTVSSTGCLVMNKMLSSPYLGTVQLNHTQQYQNTSPFTV